MGTGLQELYELLDTNECTCSTTTEPLPSATRTKQETNRIGPTGEFGSSPAPLNYHRDSSIPRGYSSMLARKIQTSSKLAALISALAFLMLASSFANSACAQAIAEAAGATSVSAAATSSVKPVTMPKLPVP